MTGSLFREVRHSLGAPVTDKGLGRIGLPATQRPFIWTIAGFFRQCQRNLVVAA